MRAWCVDNGFHSTLLRQLPTVAIIGLRTTSLNAPQPGSLLKGHDFEDNSDKDSISFDIYGETSQPPLYREIPKHGRPADKAAISSRLI
jgi:hypothetical protein